MSFIWGDKTSGEPVTYSAVPAQPQPPALSIERLRELERYIGSFTPWDDISKGVLKDVLRLIDWAIQQINKPAAWYPDAQSVVTGDKPVQDDVQRAIDVIGRALGFQQEIIDAFTCNGRDTRQNPSLDQQKETRDALDLAIRALRQMKPPAGDYDGAILRLKKVNASHQKALNNTYDMDVDYFKRHRTEIADTDFAIQCLEYCKGRDAK